MADHVRKQIRDRAAVLLTDLTTTGDRVFKTRTLKVPADKLPCLLIYTLEEDSELVTMAADPTLMREAGLVIVGLAQAAANLDDLLDRIAAEVETALGADPKLAGLAKNSWLEETAVSPAGEGEQEQGSIALTFTVQYTTKRSDPAAAA